jgi:hypothetical protein
MMEFLMRNVMAIGIFLWIAREFPEAKKYIFVCEGCANWGIHMMPSCAFGFFFCPRGCGRCRFDVASWLCGDE